MIIAWAVERAIIDADAELKGETNVNVSVNGVNLVAQFEGYVGHPYNDPAGYATIGYGHLIGYRHVNAHDLKEWANFNHDKAIALLKHDLQRFVTSVNQYTHVQLTQPQFDALVDFTYNLGGGSYAPHHSINIAVNSKPQGTKPAEAQLAAWHNRVHDALMQYVHAGAHVLPGLVHRREIESYIFSTGHYH